MGCKELIESLRKAADKSIQEIRREAEREAEKIRTDALSRIESLRSRYAHMVSFEARQQAERLLAEAEKKARAVRLAAEKAFSDRCLSIATSSLHALRVKGYGEVFNRLASELPPLEWKRVKVNPDDSELAARIFPYAEVILDPSISGGLDVETADGRIRVVNTFEKRLERVWEDIFRQVISEVLSEVRGGEAAGAA